MNAKLFKENTDHIVDYAISHKIVEILAYNETGSTSTDTTSNRGLNILDEYGLLIIIGVGAFLSIAMIAFIVKRKKYY